MILPVLNAIYVITSTEAWKIQDFNGVCEVTGSNPVEVMNFSGFYIRNYINCVQNCEDHSLFVNGIATNKLARMMLK